MTDTRAAEAIARHLRGLSIQGTDPDVAALEILQILRGHGWRHTQVLALPAWQPPGRPLPPEAVHAAAARARDALTKENP